jgi:hypothetical protein
MAVFLALAGAVVALRAIDFLTRPKLSGLPPLRLAAGAALSAVRYRQAVSTDLLSACPHAPRRPIAVMISNDPAARPATGIDAACLVYEVPIEAAFPRLMAVYTEALPETVGPIRSVRPAFLELSSELGAVVAHAGQSTDALRAIRDRKYPVVNEFWTPAPFRRAKDRRMPHNLYADATKIAAWISDRSINAPMRETPAASGAEDPEGLPAVEVRIDHPRGYETVFRFQGGAYRREVHGAPTLDAGSGKEYQASTVVVQRVRWRGGRRGGTDVSEVDVVGGGEAFIFTRGRVVEGRWEKSSERSPTRVTTLGGAALRLPGGSVWVVFARREANVAWK